MDSSASDGLSLAAAHDGPQSPVPLGGTIPLEGVALGIDVGGTGVKAALVDLATAKLVGSRIREKTPQPSTPDAVLEVIASVVARVLAEHPVPDDVPVGCGLPGPIKGGIMKTAANLDAGWVDYPAGAGISSRLGRAVHVINDADAAGMAELAYGEAQGKSGTIILLTVGTGIGSAVISQGHMVPNTELGHLIMGQKASETLVSGAARTRRGLGWKRWAREFNAYLAMVELYLWPDLIILGGGVSKESKKYWKYLVSLAPIIGARFLNTSGIIGAAYTAALIRREASVTIGDGSRPAGGEQQATPGRRPRGAGSSPAGSRGSSGRGRTGPAGS